MIASIIESEKYKEFCRIKFHDAYLYSLHSNDAELQKMYVYRSLYEGCFSVSKSFKNRKCSYIKNCLDTHYDAIVELFAYYGVDVSLVARRLLRCGMDWATLSQIKALTEEFVDAFADKIDWDNLINCNKLPSEVIRRHYDKIPWHNSNLYLDLKDDILDEFAHLIDWGEVFRVSPHLWRDDKIEKYFIYIREFTTIERLCLRGYKLSEKFIRSYIDLYYPGETRIPFPLALSDEFIEDYADRMLWNPRNRKITVSEAIIEKFIDKISWNNINYTDLSEEIIIKYHNKVNWDMIIYSKGRKLSEAVIDKHTNRIEDWGAVWICCNLSEDFIRKYIKKVDWTIIHKYQDLSEKFIEDFADKIKWREICHYQETISESFIIKYMDKLYNGERLNFKEEVVKNLSDEFLYEYADRINWESITLYRELTEDFIIKNIDYLCFDCKRIYDYLSHEMLLRYKDKINWNTILTLNRDNNKYDDLIIACGDSINWENINYDNYSHIPFNAVIKYLNRLNLKHIIQSNCHLTEKFIEAYIDDIEELRIGGFMIDFSLEFIKKYSHKLPVETALYYYGVRKYLFKK